MFYEGQVKKNKISKLFGSLSFIFIALLLGLFAVIIIPSYEKVLSLFGYETREVLKEKLTIANNNVQIAANANKESTDSIEILQRSIENRELIIVEQKKQEKIVQNTTANVRKKNNERINQVAQKYQESIKNVEDKNILNKLEVERIDGFSDSNLLAIWQSYCSFEYNKEACEKPNNGYTTQDLLIACEDCTDDGQTNHLNVDNSEPTTQLSYDIQEDNSENLTNIENFNNLQSG